MNITSSSPWSTTSSTSLSSSGCRLLTWCLLHLHTVYQEITTWLVYEHYVIIPLIYPHQIVVYTNLILVSTAIYDISRNHHMVGARCHPLWSASMMLSSLLAWPSSLASTCSVTPPGCCVNIVLSSPSIWILLGVNAVHPCGVLMFSVLPEHFWLDFIYFVTFIFIK